MEQAYEVRTGAKPADGGSQARVIARLGPAGIAQRALATALDQSPRVTALRALGDTLRREPPAPGQPAPDGGLPADLRAGVEALSGVAMGDVKVHRNSSRPAQLGALAYARGREIHLAAGQERHLPHEAWHIVQQAQGRVRPTLQMKAGIAVNDERALEREADVMGRRALAQGARSRRSGTPAPAPGDGGVVQREPIVTRILGLTHLVTAVGGSLYDGVEEREVPHGAAVTIETADRIRSRRGPNQEIFGEADRLAERVYTWVRVAAVGDTRLEGPVYVREDTLADRPPAPQDVDASGVRERLAPPSAPTAPRPASVWFTSEEILGECDTIARVRPELRNLNVLPGKVNGLLKVGATGGWLQKDEPQRLQFRYRGLEGFEGHLRLAISQANERETPDRGTVLIATAILAVAGKSMTEALHERLEEGTIFKDWYHDFAGMLTMLADRRDLSVQAIAKLLKYELMRHQLQAPFDTETMKRTGRQTSPLVSEDYARGMRTRLWSVATDIQLDLLLSYLFKPDDKQRANKIKDFNRTYCTVSAPAPFLFAGFKPAVFMNVPADLATNPQCVYLSPLKLELIPIKGDKQKFEGAVSSHMGGRGLRSSPSESADVVALAMARIIKSGDIGAALELIEKQFRKGAGAKVAPKTPLSILQFDSRMLIAPAEHDPRTGRWRDPLLSSTTGQLERLAEAFQALGSLIAADDQLPKLFSSNFSVFTNLVRGDPAAFFGAQTPAQVTGAVTDALDVAARYVKAYAPDGPSPKSASLSIASLAHFVQQDAKPHEVGSMPRNPTLPQRKFYLERFYQLMQTLHEAVRFRLSWAGVDPGILHSGIESMLPKGAAPTSTHVAPHGLALVDQIYRALGTPKAVGVLKSAYYETADVLRRPDAPKEERPTAIPNVEDKAVLTQDLIVVEPHPNNAEDRDVRFHDPLMLIQLLKKSGEHHTVLMDVTLNHLGEPEIADILKAAAPLILEGRLNLILLQSGTKFLQHGMDISSLGIAAVFNSKTHWVEFNKAMEETRQQTPRDDSVYLGHMLHTNKENLGRYISSIRDNTAYLKKRLLSTLVQPNALEVTFSSDVKTVYVAIAPTEKFVSTHFGVKLTGDKEKDDEAKLKAKTAAMSKIYHRILEAMASLSLAGRPSFGFNLSNLGECITTIRITPGIEEMEYLHAYAEGIAQVGADLMKRL